jgi:hypothetical protein
MNKQELIEQALITELENCQNDSVYNDNTLHDFLLYGFKGLNNMNEQELSEFLESALNWRKG